MMSSRRTDPRVRVDVSGVFGKKGFRAKDYKWLSYSDTTKVGDLKRELLIMLNFPGPELFCIRSGEEELDDEQLVSKLDQSKLKKLNLFCKDVEKFHDLLRQSGLL